MDNRPIGVFDSGLGGLTVLSAMKKMLPQEDFIYFGDCGRIPYGTKSDETVIKYTFQDINFLLSHDVKAIVIACNTASAYAYKSASKEFSVPIFEVVSPGARAAVRATHTGKIGVIATQGTVSTGVYESAMRSSTDKELEVISVACPLFVPLAEAGWWHNEVSILTANKYLEDIKTAGVDTLVLGCTHYPLLTDTISEVMGSDVFLVSSGQEVASDVQKYLLTNDMCADKSDQEIQYFTSDDTATFTKLGESFLGEPIINVKKVEIDKY